VIYTAVGKDTHVIENKPDPEVESEAVRRLAEALDPSVIDALLADAKTAGTRLPSPGHSRERRRRRPR
jgi:putative transposase